MSTLKILIALLNLWPFIVRASINETALLRRSSFHMLCDCREGRFSPGNVQSSGAIEPLHTLCYNGYTGA